jgi:phosphoglycolate phosphatase-like HAD superfamily hydrolase
MLSETPRSHCVALLDLDGTLLDSNAAHANAWHEAISAAGYPPVPLDKLRALIGVGADKLLRFALGVDRRDSEWRRITALRRRIFREKYLDTLCPLPGVHTLLHTLREAGWQPVIATSASSDEVDGLLRRAGVGNLVTDVVSASHYMPSKPDPDIFELALRRVRCDRESARVLGDTPYDLMAAARARLRSVALRCGGWSDSALAQADAIFDDPLDLVKRFDVSPFAARATGAGRQRVGAAQGARRRAARTLPG